MHRSRGDEDGVAGGWIEGCETVSNAVVCERFAQHLRRGAGCQARKDAAILPNREDDPGLCFAALAGGEALGLQIRWVYLHRQRRTRIKKFKQERESIECCASVS